MKNWLNCVFWNIQDKRHSKQRGDAGTKLLKDEAAQKRRADKNTENRERASNLADAVVNIARTQDIDLFLFAEYHLDQSYEGGDAALFARLEQETGRQFYSIENRLRKLVTGTGAPIELGKDKHITIFSSIERKIEGDSPELFSVVAVPSDPLGEEPFDESRLTLRVLYVPNEPDPLLLACVHLVSKRDADDVTQREEARRIFRRIRYAEKEFFKEKPHRTVVVGDFNMNPWEEGMVLPDAFHAVGWFDLASRGQTKVLWGKEYPYFYNPTPLQYNPIPAREDKSRVRPGGTYAFSTGNYHIVRRWNLFDQILLRSAALEYWPLNHPDDCLRILHKAGNLELIHTKEPKSEPEPDSKHYSDHLPILFRLGKYDASIFDASITNER